MGDLNLDNVHLSDPSTRHTISEVNTLRSHSLNRLANPDTAFKRGTLPPIGSSLVSAEARLLTGSEGKTGSGSNPMKFPSPNLPNRISGDDSHDMTTAEMNQHHGHVMFADQQPRASASYSGDGPPGPDATGQRTAAKAAVEKMIFSVSDEEKRRGYESELDDIMAMVKDTDEDEDIFAARCDAKLEDLRRNVEVHLEAQNAAAIAATQQLEAMTNSARRRIGHMYKAVLCFLFLQLLWIGGMTAIPKWTVNLDTVLPSSYWATVIVYAIFWGPHIFTLIAGFVNVCTRSRSALLAHCIIAGIFACGHIGAVAYAMATDTSSIVNSLYIYIPYIASLAVEVVIVVLDSLILGFWKSAHADAQVAPATKTDPALGNSFPAVPLAP
eukprot:TRINITY_DN6070_c0_g1_i1.p1 TRINITY_DN6070_c0_g1~~TRINITY_DN6070_c0_g1_i1.p1  ORF type:complete len:384 (-),score=69.22 TRINITY_DN6070_c0_g1_i1:249-1400(-)